MTEIFRVSLERILLRKAIKAAEENGASSGEIVRLMPLWDDMQR
jgi:hypothetical protein